MKPLILFVVAATIFLQATCTESSSVSSSASSYSRSSRSSSSKTEKIQKTSPPQCTTSKKGKCKEYSCGKDEIYVECPFGVCVPKTCDDVGYPVPCPDLLPNATCPDGPGCICKENYVRSKSGNCIPVKDCPSCGGDENAVSGCSSNNCNRLCSNYDKEPQGCTKECLYNSCQCKKGYVYDEITKNCVRPKDCSKLECTEPNQVYDPCPARCPFRTCGIDDETLDCVAPLPPGDPDCPPAACRCDDGFYKNDVGQCVRKEDCPVCTAKNEIYDPCRAPCPPQRCDVDITVILCQVPPQVGDPDCDPGCRCIDGYVRNNTGPCIPREDCPKCPANQIYDECDAPCPGRRCDVDETVIKCAAPPKPGSPDCVVGCRCIDGYVEDYDGVCIPKEECPKCPPNQIYDECDAPCPGRRCDVDERLIKCAAPPKPGSPDCVVGCRCIDGYVKDYDGVCIPKEECPKCPPNQIYDECDAPCPGRRCDVDERLIRCAAPPKPGSPDCLVGCRCIDGYVKDYDGVCIPKEKCPKCPPNQIYDECDAPCPGRRCDVDERLIKCAAPPKPGSPDCVVGCRCIDGYVKDYEGVCIPKEKCPKCTKPHEVYDPCPPSTCPPPTCENVNKRYNCPNIPVDDEGQIIQTCNGQCVCEEGYFRNLIGECIAKEDCAKCTGPHEYFTCGPACDNECALLDKQNQTNCPIKNKKCNPKCYCEEGYARDEKKICIPIDDCKVPKCKKNEVYDPCPSCKPLNCSQVGIGPLCESPPPEGSCFDPPACVCKEGYVRNDNTGVCIPTKKCPSCGGDRNATIGCGVNCNKRCRDVGKESGACIEVCFENKCDCKDGYFLDENTNQCVKSEDCTPVCPIDEIYSYCTQAECRAKTCSQLGYPVACPRIDPKFCKKGCVCKNGYVRGKDGFCIPETDCPSCGGDVNAQAGCGINCNKRCEDIGQEPGACIALCLLNACDCKEGYYYDKELKKCVLPNECSPPICNKNEYYNNCSNSDCSPQSCTQLGNSIQCADIGDPSQCLKDCLCKQGYVRNNKGICVPAGECPSCGGDPNAVSGCGVNCNKKCSNIGQKEPEACILICYPNACDCREGYFYDEVQGKCVLPEDCAPQCPKNEYYSNCTNADCSVQECTQVGFPIKCSRIKPEYCKKGCLCKEGYARNKKGVCVPINKCPKCKGDPNRKPGCGVYCNQRCSLIGEEPYGCAAICYDNACDCKEGYYLDEVKDKCVLPKDCTPPCPKNEYYSNCTNGDCSVQDCTQVGFSIKCPKIKPENCITGCLCKQGYARNKKGVCVPVKKCPSCKGDPNRVPGCGIYCNQKCSDIGKEPGACILLCRSNSCDCKKGYYLDKNTDKCVLPKDCTPVCTENEVYSECVNGGCDARNCSQLGKPTRCVKIDPKYCIKGCVCKEGYLRNKKGVCVPESECNPPVCTENEVYSECVNGGCDARNCSQLGKPVPCVKLDPKSCIKGCICKEGYLRNKKGVCVPESECNPQCGSNEEYNPCAYNCPPNTCESLDKVYACPLQTENNCKGRCVCKKGYYRNKIGECISEADCRKCTGPNEYFSCGVACDNVCATLSEQNQTNCPIVNIQCNRMCYCEKNYARASNNTCIPIDKCNEPVCTENEVYSECVNGGCDARNCSQLGKPVPCVKLDPKSCIKGCVCKEGYLRNKKGVCVPESECNPQCGFNEEYNPCAYNCPPNTCESLDKVYRCPLQTKKNCEGLCVCKKGYYRNKIGTCISEADCRKCMGPNEFFSCGGACDNVCATLSEQNQTNCPIVNIQCNRMCYCEDNYARARNNTCIPIDKCNEPQCGVNEKLETCPGKLRGPLCCSQLGYPLKDKSDKPCGKTACVCVDGYVRNRQKVCIPKEKCPSCKGDKNAVSGCGVNCGKRCEDLGDGVGPCIEICYENSCDCRDGYYYDKTQKKCVLPGECTSICKTNERFENCNNPDSICRAQTCSELGFPLNCTETECKKGCYCIDNYVRDENGRCVPVKDCPSCGGDPNAQPGCGVNCGKLCRNAKNPKKPGPCPLFCRLNGCDCKDGFYLDQNINQCVKAEECSPICDKPNEEYDPCTNGGCGFRNCDQLGGPNLCIDPIECTKGCKCQQDYLRLKNGTCVPIETCPEATCPKNERFVKCPLALCQPLTCEELGFPVSCPDLGPDGYCPGGPGCVCEENYVRNADGKCIPKNKCPSCGGDPHARSGCGVNCGTHCDNVFNISRPCLRICYPNDCECVKGYFYDEVQETCVKPDKCSPPCKENEVRDYCVNGYCGMRNCSEVGGPILCVDPIECKIGCTCKEGYLRLDSTYECVPECECPKKPENCPADPCEDEPSSPVNTTEALANFQKGNNDLTVNFLNQLVTKRPGESFMFSALSVLIALAQLALYAIGVSFKQLMALLYLKSKDEIRTIFPILIDNYGSQTSVIFKEAIKYYGNINVPFSEKFKKEAIEIFDSEGESIDFSKKEESADTINEWVASKTNNLIKDLVSPDMFSEDTRMVLVNALYFLGDWIHQFNPNDTMPRDFYIGEKDTDVVSIPTMTQKGRFRYGENEEFDCQVLQLPYKGGNFTIDFYLPNKRTGLAEMVQKIQKSDNFFKIRDDLSYEEVIMYIPKIGVSTDLSDLNDLLKAANLTAVFDPGNDEFKCIFEDNTQNVYISDSVQKTYINVTETGTEAAAATGFIISTTSAVLEPPRVYTFDFNHPGLFLIMLKDDDITDTAIFAGAYTGKGIN